MRNGKGQTGQVSLGALPRGALSVSTSLQHGSLRVVGPLTEQLKAFRATVPTKQVAVASSVPVMTKPPKLHGVISTVLY